MSSHPSPNPSILQNATPALLEQAAAYNHRELFCQNAMALNGEVETANGLTWTFNGTAHGSMIPFPSLEDNSADNALDTMMAYYGAHRPKSAGCWSLDPPQPLDLGIKLLARGFQPGWQPQWMALDLEAIKTNHIIPACLWVRADNESPTDEVKNLPYSGNNGAVSNALMQAHPELTQRFIATINGKIVGHSCVFFSIGEYGAAGIYNVGVVPEARQQGIGKAVVIAACLYAKEQGYRYAVLNGTGRRMYEQVGFQWISAGFTWWLMSQEFIINPPLKSKVSLAEAVGKGEIDMLNNLANQFTANDLSTPITNGMTLLQLAIHCSQPIAAEWLVEHGAEYSLLDAWDLGWKERAAIMLKTDREQVNRLYGDRQITLLHVAAERNDITLAQLALSARPDLEVKDKNYNSTALGWAQHLQRRKIVELIKSYSEKG